MDYTFHQLRIFCKVAELQSITRAAEALHLSQPAVSIQVKKFQDQFPIPLTQLVGKQLCITDFGQSIAAIAQSILKESDALLYKTRQYAGLLTGKLRISSASTGKYVIPYFLTEFLGRHPGIDLVLDVSNKESVLNHLRHNRIDFALVSVVPDDLDTEEELLLKNKLYLVGNSRSPEKDKPLIFREKGSATRLAMDRYFHTETGRTKLELTSNEAVKQAVIAGLGYSILPLIGLKNELHNGELFILPSKGLPIETTWRLIWLRKQSLSPIARAYLDYVRTSKASIMEKHFSWYHSF